jgi:ABC-type dipeptide/oligopeptide/nickel transport system ATPase subunit
MNAEVTRVFTDTPAVRHATPLLFGIYGPSGAGKTFSALRVATGIQRVSGGEIFGIDTESNRMLQYAEHFKFRHVPFGMPFSSLDYKAVIEYCVSKGAKTIIVDSMSHEHEGPGGVLEEHDQEVERLMAAWRCTEEKANIPAWGRPKRKRQTFINAVLQMNCNFIFCFRAKDKVKLGGGKVVQLGFMPIAGEEFVYEMSATALLLPGAKGVPTWNSNEIGEKLMIKLPNQFEELFRDPRQLDESMGTAMASWAAGTKPVSNYDIQELTKAYTEVNDATTFAHLEAERKRVWSQLPPNDLKTALKDASDAAKARMP